jgi:hypothetical protein
VLRYLRERLSTFSAAGTRNLTVEPLDPPSF